MQCDRGRTSAGTTDANRSHVSCFDGVRDEFVPQPPNGRVGGLSSWAAQTSGAGLGPEPGRFDMGRAGSGLPVSSRAGPGRSVALKGELGARAARGWAPGRVGRRWMTRRD